MDPRYRKQHEVVQKILHVLEVEPENKNKLIGLFEEMQQYGNPPETIAPVSGFFWFHTSIADHKIGPMPTLSERIRMLLCNLSGLKNYKWMDSESVGSEGVGSEGEE